MNAIKIVEDFELKSVEVRAEYFGKTQLDVPTKKHATIEQLSVYMQRSD